MTKGPILEPNNPGAPRADGSYSRAFEQIVKSPDDVVGLLAYALYKKVIHVKMKEGQYVPSSNQRRLTDAEIDLYVSKADGYLRIFSKKSSKLRSQK